MRTVTISCYVSFSQGLPDMFLCKWILENWLSEGQRPLYMQKTNSSLLRLTELKMFLVRQQNNWRNKTTLRENILKLYPSRHNWHRHSWPVWSSSLNSFCQVFVCCLISNIIQFQLWLLCSCYGALLIGRFLQPALHWRNIWSACAFKTLRIFWAKQIRIQTLPLW